MQYGSSSFVIFSSSWAQVLRHRLTLQVDFDFGTHTPLFRRDNLAHSAQRADARVDVREAHTAVESRLHVEASSVVRVAKI